MLIVLALRRQSQKYWFLPTGVILKTAWSLGSYLILAYSDKIFKKKSLLAHWVEMINLSILAHINHKNMIFAYWDQKVNDVGFS